MRTPKLSLLLILTTTPAIHAYQTCMNEIAIRAVCQSAHLSLQPTSRHQTRRKLLSPKDLLELLSTLSPKHALAYTMWAIQQDSRDPYKDTTAHVGHGLALPEREQTFLHNRDAITRPVLEEVLNVKLPEQPLRVAWGGSGGGYRALCFNLGFFKALEDMSLFNTMTYLGAVSGSTWLLGAWLRHQTSAYNLEDILAKQLKHQLIDHFDLSETIKLGTLRAMCGAEITLVHIFGAMLAKRMFGNHSSSYHIRLSDFEPLFLDPAAKTPPLPFYTAGGSHDPDNMSIAFSPINTYIDLYNQKTNEYTHTNYPTWALGRRWKYGKSTYGMSEQFGYILGICGSAFTISIAEVIERYSSMLPSALVETSKWISTGQDQQRLSPGYHWNPDYKVKKRPYYKEKKSDIVDFGVQRNCGFTEVILAPNRDVKILFIGDASGNVKGAPMLRKEQEHAYLLGREFPEVDYENIDKKPFHILRSKNMLVFYLMFQNQDDTPLTNTFVTQYDKPKEAIGRIAAQAYDVLMANEAEIKNAMREFIQ
jgi:hypothetical protein